MKLALDDVRHVHFVGIGGIGMSALARLLLARGYIVSGSDRSPGEQGEILSRLGATILAGHRADYVEGADLVIVTPATAHSPEIGEAHARHIQVAQRADLLASVMLDNGIAIAGTHGKTTTSALIGWILTQAQLDPTILIGGVSANLGSNARVGRPNLVVAEADEFAGAFLQLHPEIAVITTVEPDHLDYFGTLDALHAAFRQFSRQVRRSLVVCADDPIALRLASDTPAKLYTYGINNGEWRAHGIRDGDGESVFILCHGHVERQYRIPLAGTHNVLNAVAAVLVAKTMGVEESIIASSLRSFAGVARRAEIKGEADGTLVIDDYAHHPTEVLAALAALKQRYRRPLRVVFQPHTYSRTKALLPEFASAFVDADAVYLLDIYAAREADTLGISGRHLADAVAGQHAFVTYAESKENALASVLRECQPGDIVVTMGAGDVYQLAPLLLEGLRSR